MMQSIVGKWRVGGGLQVLLGLWLMLGIFILSVLGSCMSHCWCRMVNLLKFKLNSKYYNDMGGGEV